MSLSSLRLRLLLLVALAVLPGIALLLYVARVERRSQELEATEQARRLAALVGEQQQRSLDAAQGLLTGLTSLPSVAALDGRACGAALEQLKPRVPFFNNFGVADASGKLVCQALGAGTYDIADRAYFRRAPATGEFAAGEFQVSRANARPTLTFGLPLLDASQHARAVLFVGLDLTVMQQRLDQLPMPTEATLAVLDRAGVVLAQRPSVSGAVGQPADRSLAVVLTGGEAGTANLSAEGQGERIWAWRTIHAGADPSAALYAVASVPRGLVQAPMRSAYGRSLLILVALAVAAVVIAAAAAEVELVRPVKGIVAAARRLSRGDLAARTGARPRGEIGELGVAFDEMARSLEVLTRQNLLILESVGEGILGIDPGRCVTFANPAAARMLGRAPAELRGSLVDTFVPPPEPSAAPGPIAQAMADGSVRQVSATFVRADGSRFPAEYLATPIRDQGRVVGAVVSFRDISERRRLEEQLRHAQKMEAVGQLAGGVAHDFNNLLTAIMSFARFAKGQMADDLPAAPDVEEIIAAAGRAATLTRQLLAFSRRQVLEPAIIDLGQTVNDLDRMLRRLIGEDVTLETRIARPVGMIKADRGHVEQVIVNLVVNAREAMPSGGQLLIDVRDVPEDAPERQGDPDLPKGPLVRLSVADTGSGMDEATLSRIFEPFFTTKPTGKGTGLGLSTVYGIVTQSGGAIRVRSVVAKGTTFHVYLPRADGEIRPAAQSSQAPMTGTETVLVVEDDPAVRTLARRSLAQMGYRVIEASRPAEARNALARQGGPLHLLLLDVILPEVSGPELARQLLSAWPDARVLYMSGYTGTHLATEDVVASGHRFLQKPFSPEVLLRAVRDALDAPARPARVVEPPEPA